MGVQVAPERRPARRRACRRSAIGRRRKTWVAEDTGAGTAAGRAGGRARAVTRPRGDGLNGAIAAWRSQPLASSYAASSRSAAAGAVSSPASTSAADLVADRRHAGRAAQPLVELVADQRPGELQLLLGALVGQAVRAEVLAVGQHPLPDVVHPGRRVSPEQVSTGGAQPSPPARTSRSAPASSRAAAVASARPVAVGLVDRDHVGDLQDALLDALELVAGAGQGQEQERVDHPGDRDLRLADADGLDEHDVVPRRLQDVIACAVARATPPSVPAVGEGRM